MEYATARQWEQELTEERVTDPPKPKTEYARASSQIPPRLYHIERPEPRAGRAYLAGKRVFDFCVALIGLMILAIPMCIIAILIRIDSPGDAFFRQERLGKDGRPFTMYKFRSMRTDAEADGPKWAEAQDDRCTKIGRKLRRSRLDELPQLLNILRGDMSLVGPRPERAYFYEKFETYIDGFSYRLLVTPGLTGLAQVSGGYELKPEEKIVYDIEYIRIRSVRMDLTCIWKTFSLVFTHKGAR